MQHNSVIVVLGMHRSGTSVLCKAIETLGVDFGDRLLEGDQWNAKGYFEHYAIQQLDDRLLRLLGVRWNSLVLSCWEDALPWVFSLKSQAIDFLRKDFSQKPLWGLKDPRMCRLLPFWKGVFDELGVAPSYVLALRNPLNVALSLNKRDDMSIHHGVLLWLSHMAAAFVDSAGARCAVVEYDYLLANPAAELERVSTLLGMPIAETAATAREEFVSTFLDRDLQHNQQSIDALNAHPDVPIEVKELYAAMLAMASGTPSDRDWEQIRVRCADVMADWWPREVGSLHTHEPDAMAFRESVAMIARLRSELLVSNAEIVASQSQIELQAALIGGKDAEIVRLRSELESCRWAVASKDQEVARLGAEVLRLGQELEQSATAKQQTDQFVAAKQLELQLLEQENGKIREELAARVDVIRRYELLLKMAGAKLD